jgi:hypothetical protein
MEVKNDILKGILSTDETTKLSRYYGLGGSMVNGEIEELKHQGYYFNSISIDDNSVYALLIEFDNKEVLKDYSDYEVLIPTCQASDIIECW